MWKIIKFMSEYGALVAAGVALISIVCYVIDKQFSPD